MMRGSSEARNLSIVKETVQTGSGAHLASFKRIPGIISPEGVCPYSAPPVPISAEVKIEYTYVCVLLLA